MRRFVERRLNQAYIRKIAILVLAVYLIVLTVSFVTARRGKTIFGPLLGADFRVFYVAGQIYNKYGPASIYDVSLQRLLYKENFPDAPANEELIYANAPFFVAPFILLSRLPYAWAYLIWLVFSLSLYLAGFSILWRALESLPQELWLTGLLLSLSFWPFLVECLAGGQTSAAGFFCLALVIALETRPFWSGAVLALCAYKPTLLFLVVPMLLITGRWLSLAGVMTGSVALALISLSLVGIQGCLNFLNRLLFFSSAATNTEAGLRSWKYVDINAFMRLLLPHQAHLRWTITVAIVLLVLPFLIAKWWRLRKDSQRRLVWALTLTWTPVLSMYMGIYDSTILVLAVLLFTAELYSRGYRSDTLPFGYRCVLLSLYLSPLFTQNIALLTGVQIYTLAVAAFGIYQLRYVDDLIPASEFAIAKA